MRSAIASDTLAASWLVIGAALARAQLIAAPGRPTSSTSSPGADQRGSFVLAARACSINVAGYTGRRPRASAPPPTTSSTG